MITIANLKLTNTSSRAPQTQKMAAWSIWDVVELVHAKLHGQSVGANVGGLVRAGLKKIKRDDGIQEFEVTYTVGITNC